MKRAVAYVGVWLAATTAAVTLSWLGVRDVIRGAVFDRPDAIPLVSPVMTEEPPPTTTSEAATVDTSAPEQEPPEPNPPAAEDAGHVRTYDVKGGKVVLSVHTESTELISVCTGYTMQTWATSPVGCGWNSHRGPTRFVGDRDLARPPHHG